MLAVAHECDQLYVNCGIEWFNKAVLLLNSFIHNCSLNKDVVFVQNVGFGCGGLLCGVNASAGPLKELALAVVGLEEKVATQKHTYVCKVSASVVIGENVHEWVEVIAKCVAVYLRHGAAWLRKAFAMLEVSHSTWHGTDMDGRSAVSSMIDRIIGTVSKEESKRSEELLSRSWRREEELLRLATVKKAHELQRLQWKQNKEEMERKVHLRFCSVCKSEERKRLRLAEAKEFAFSNQASMERGEPPGQQLFEE